MFGENAIFTRCSQSVGLVRCLFLWRHTQGRSGVSMYTGDQRKGISCSIIQEMAALTFQQRIPPSRFSEYLKTVQNSQHHGQTILRLVLVHKLRKVQALTWIHTLLLFVVQQRPCNTLVSQKEYNCRHSYWYLATIRKHQFPINLQDWTRSNIYTDITWFHWRQQGQL